MPRACFVANPLGGSAIPTHELESQLETLLGANWDAVVRPTTCRGDATRLAAQAVAEGFDVVVAAGGDGTVNEVVQALVHTRAALGVLPLGTGNVWAHEVGIPLDVEGAVRVLGEGQVRSVDVGLAGDRYFLLMAGVGYDAEVLQQTDSQFKRRLGMLAYVVRGFVVAMSYRGRRVVVESDGIRRNFRSLLLVIGNTRRYGGQVEVTSEARIDDGLLDVCVFRGVSLLKAALYLLEVLVRRHLRDPGVSYFRSRRVLVSADPPQPVQVDGETIGETPMAFSVVERALRVVVPAAARPDLFSPQNRIERLDPIPGNR